MVLGIPLLQGYEFKIFYDSEFKNEFVSTGTTRFLPSNWCWNSRYRNYKYKQTFDALLTLNYNIDNPEKLYYNVQKSGYISTSDFVDVVNPSSIYYEDSVFDGKYNI